MTISEWLVLITLLLGMIVWLGILLMPGRRPTHLPCGCGGTGVVDDWPKSNRRAAIARCDDCGAVLYREY